MTKGVGARAQEYLAQWVAKVTSAEKDYRGAVDQMERPAAPGRCQKLWCAAAGRQCFTHHLRIMGHGPGSLTAPAGRQ